MKIGDKVRFLNEIGGGVVKGFKDKDTAIVEDGDGFEIPILKRECVVIDENKETRISPAADADLSEGKKGTEEKEEEYTYEETEGNDSMNVYLAFVPDDIKNIGNCSYSSYIVNASNYFIYLNLAKGKDGIWESFFDECIEPNTKILAQEFKPAELNNLESLNVQFIALKRGKSYELKNPYSGTIKNDLTKFYKLHCFEENEFFEEKALIYTLVENDKEEYDIPLKGEEIKLKMEEKIKEDLEGKKSFIFKKEQKHKSSKGIVEVDLHSEELLETTAGMGNSDILEYQLDVFRKTMEEYRNKKGQKIVFIHGKGEGVLRNVILKELKSKYKHCLYQDASFKEYGFGATMVIIK